MDPRLTRQTYFHAVLGPHQHKYFRPEEIDAVASRGGSDQEREIATFFTLVTELKHLRGALADPVTAPQMPFSAVIWPYEVERDPIEPAAVLLHCCYFLLHMKG